VALKLLHLVRANMKIEPDMRSINFVIYMFRCSGMQGRPQDRDGRRRPNCSRHTAQIIILFRTHHISCETSEYFV
jgi:hypothetical protein